MGNTPGDLENVPAGLLFAGGLTDNGGPTQTIALRDAADNPALGGADPAAAPATDQRGVARPQPEGTNPDIGAFELGRPSPALSLRPTWSTAPRAARSCVDRRRRPDPRPARRRPAVGVRRRRRTPGRLRRRRAGRRAGARPDAGGGGADRFVLRQPEAAPPTAGYDEILDFARSQHDRIDLQPIDARAGLAGDQAFAFVGRQAFTEAGQLRYEATADGDFLVSGNTDRDLDAELAFIVRTGAEQLEAGDFLL